MFDYFALCTLRGNWAFCYGVKTCERFLKFCLAQGPHGRRLDAAPKLGWAPPFYLAEGSRRPPCELNSASSGFPRIEGGCARQFLPHPFFVFADVERDLDGSLDVKIS